MELGIPAAVQNPCDFFFFLHLHGSPQAAELIAPLSPKVSLLLWHFTWASFRVDRKLLEGRDAA